MVYLKLVLHLKAALSWEHCSHELVLIEQLVTERKQKQKKDSLHCDCTHSPDSHVVVGIETSLGSYRFLSGLMQLQLLAAAIAFFFVFPILFAFRPHAVARVLPSVREVARHTQPSLHENEQRLLYAQLLILAVVVTCVLHLQPLKNIK